VVEDHREQVLPAESFDDAVVVRRDDRGVGVLLHGDLGADGSRSRRGVGPRELDDLARLQTGELGHAVRRVLDKTFPQAVEAEGVALYVVPVLEARGR
jgi:hypothetical protein